MKQVGIDVDTFRGTRDGVPRLLALLGKHGIQASFFQRRAGQYGAPFMAPVKPKFLWKMLRQRGLAVWLGYSAGRHRVAGAQDWRG